MKNENSTCNFNKLENLLFGIKFNKKKKKTIIRIFSFVWPNFLSALIP